MDHCSAFWVTISKNLFFQLPMDRLPLEKRLVSTNGDIQIHWAFQWHWAVLLRQRASSKTCRMGWIRFLLQNFKWQTANNDKHLKAFIVEDTSISATMLLHKSKLNPVVFCECPERSDKKHTQNHRWLEAKQE